MAFITLDFETYYGDKYTLKSKTYEQYMQDLQFKVHGVGIKINDEPTIYYPDHEVEAILKETFPKGNTHTLICHNTNFDGTILSWWYGLAAQRYYCTQAMSRALWNQARHGLEDLAIRLWPDDETMRKGKELILFKNIHDLTPEQQEIMGGYCIQDVDLTFEAFAFMWKVFPEDELETLDLTLQMFIHPEFVLDQPAVEKHIVQVKKTKAEIIAASGTNKTTLASGPKFVKYIKDTFDLDVPYVHSPTPKNPDNYKHTLSKSDLNCINFIKEHRDEHPDLVKAFAGRFAAASTLEESRAIRLLEHSKALPHKPEPVIALPLNYAAAHTLRWGGTNKINAQNFGRGSPLRLAIQAPKNYHIAVADLSNIEARMLAWWSGEEQLLDLFRNGEDVYSIYAGKIYNRPVDRKQKLQDDAGNYLDADGRITTKDFAHKPDFIEGHVGKTAVLGLGYQMGPGKFQDTLEQGALGGPPVFLSTSECYKIVHEVFRAENPNIVRTWNECNGVIASMITLKPGESYEWRGLIVEHERIKLPNGMYLNYPGLKWEENEDTGFSECTYWNGKFRTKIYPGKLTENIVQALSRIVMAIQMVAINNYLKAIDPMMRVLLTVHDEVLALVQRMYADKYLAKMIDFMRIPPDWCRTLPLNAEGGHDIAYSK